MLRNFNKAGARNRRLQPKGPRYSDRYRWTNHVQRKMHFYGLTPSRVLRVVNAPQRMEEGVAEGTLAGMQRAGTKTRPWEIWAMWREEKSKVALRQAQGGNNYFSQRKVIITAWRYPGVSPVRGAVPIPPEVLAELEAEGEV